MLFNIIQDYYSGPVEGELHYGMYAPHHPLLWLIQPLTGEVLFHVSANLPGFRIPEDSIIIKSYSENAGLDHILVEAGMISPQLENIDTGIYGLTVHKMQGDLLSLHRGAQLNMRGNFNEY